MSSRYLITPTEKNEDKKTIYSQTYYPEIGFYEDDVYIITSTQDRFDLIAYDFWGDKDLWWVVPMVNNLECNSFFPPVGIQLRIPRNIIDILNKFNKENEQ